MRDSRVLVTGGAGFIGSHLVDALMSRDYRVRVVDNLSSGGLTNIERWLGHPGFEFVEGDLKSPETCRKSVDGVKTVCHLAANPDVRMSADDPSTHFRENILVTFNLLEALRESKTRNVVFASSSTVYGEPAVFPTPEDYGPLLPISVYGGSKLACEALICSYCYTFGFRGALLRFANIVGPRSSHGVIIDFVRKIRSDPAELEILGDGTQTKSYLYIEDLVEAFLVVMNSIEKDGNIEVYNVGSPDQISVKRIAEIVSEEMGVSEMRFRFNDPFNDGRGWKGDVKTMQLCIEKIGRLGWKPRYSSEQAVRQSCRTH